MSENEVHPTNVGIIRGLSKLFLKSTDHHAIQCSSIKDDEFGRSRNLHLNLILESGTPLSVLGSFCGQSIALGYVPAHS